MAVFSLLRPSLQRNMRAATLIVTRNNQQGFLVVKNMQKGVSRSFFKIFDNVGVFTPNRKMIVMPAKYIYNVFLDQCHFFFCLGILPIVLTVTCANVFIGQAELRDIPEGYEPQEHEYYKGPIQRFIAKCQTSYQERYEKSLHAVYEEQKKKEFRLLQRKVKTLQDNRNDYKGWYFMPGELPTVEYTKIKSNFHDDTERFKV